MAFLFPNKWFILFKKRVELLADMATLQQKEFAQTVLSRKTKGPKNVSYMGKMTREPCGLPGG